MSRSVYAFKTRRSNLDRTIVFSALVLESAMDFTEIYKQSSSLVEFSPGARFILTAVQDRLLIRQSDTFQITRTWLPDVTPSPTDSILADSKSKSNPPDDWISHIGWSCDSEYILAACAKKRVVHVFKLRDEAWNARIDAGAEGSTRSTLTLGFIDGSCIGLVKAEWAPDGRTILCFSEWGVSCQPSLTIATP